jgi:hypothetical protein
MGGQRLKRQDIEPHTPTNQCVRLSTGLGYLLGSFRIPIEHEDRKKVEGEQEAKTIERSPGMLVRTMEGRG